MLACRWYEIMSLFFIYIEREKERLLEFCSPVLCVDSKVDALGFVFPYKVFEGGTPVSNVI